MAVQCFKNLAPKYEQLKEMQNILHFTEGFPLFTPSVALWAQWIRSWSDVWAPNNSHPLPSFLLLTFHDRFSQENLKSWLQRFPSWSFMLANPRICTQSVCAETSHLHTHQSWQHLQEGMQIFMQNHAAFSTQGSKRLPTGCSAAPAPAGPWWKWAPSGCLLPGCAGDCWSLGKWQCPAQGSAA